MEVKENNCSCSNCNCSKQCGCHQHCSVQTCCSECNCQAKYQQQLDFNNAYGQHEAALNEAPNVHKDVIRDSPLEQTSDTNWYGDEAQRP